MPSSSIDCAITPRATPDHDRSMRGCRSGRRALLRCTRSAHTTVHPIVSGTSLHIVCGSRPFVDVARRSFRCLYTGMTKPSTITNNPTAQETARPLLVDVAQAATILAISRSSMYQLIWTEQLIPIRIGRSVRFSITQLEQFVVDRTCDCADATSRAQR